VRLAVFSLAILTGSVAAKEPVPADKSGYTLFNPTPRELMREMSTDRPDVTESAYSLDAGHLQIEMDVVSYTRDRHTPERDGGSESWAFATSNIKLGLTNRMDLQIVVPTYQRIRGGAEGFGDIEVRLKTNLWGNDREGTALAVMPFIKIPTASDGLGNDEVEGGIIIPFAASLPGDWGFGAMVEVDYLSDDDGSGRHLEFVTSVTLSHDIVGDLGGYVEFVSVVGTESDWVATFNGGLTFGIGEDVQLDAGVNIGLTRAAEDLTPFLGLSVRF
jgi:hypothetical protein